MAYENLKAAIKQAIKQNGNQEITGDLLQSTLLNIVNTIGADYKFLGFATPSTVPPTSEEGRLLYFTTGHGDSYVNFLTSASGTYITLEYGFYALTKEANSKYWRSDVVVPIAQGLGTALDKVMSQKAVTDNFTKEANRVNTELGKKADKTAVEAETKRAQSAEQAIIYDVSARNNGAVFESLSVLLSSSNLSTLIPTSVRHGGMTIRFVQSSDNKYVQYRLMSTSFSTNEADWQGDAIMGTDRIADGAVTFNKLYPDLHSLITNISNNYVFAGIATPTTNPGTPDGPVFYIATEVGAYSNFGGIGLERGEVAILLWDNGVWTKKVTGFVTQEELASNKTEVDGKIEEIIAKMESSYIDITDNYEFSNGSIQSLFNIKSGATFNGDYSASNNNFKHLILDTQEGEEFYISGKSEDFYNIATFIDTTTNIVKGTYFKNIGSTFIQKIVTPKGANQVVFIFYIANNTPFGIYKKISDNLEGGMWYDLNYNTSTKEGYFTLTPKDSTSVLSYFTTNQQVAIKSNFYSQLRYLSLSVKEGEIYRIHLDKEQDISYIPILYVILDDNDTIVDICLTSPTYYPDYTKIPANGTKLIVNITNFNFAQNLGDRQSSYIQKYEKRNISGTEISNLLTNGEIAAIRNGKVGDVLPNLTITPHSFAVNILAECSAGDNIYCNIHNQSSNDYILAFISHDNVLLYKRWDNTTKVMQKVAPEGTKYVYITFFSNNNFSNTIIDDIDVYITNDNILFDYIEESISNNAFIVPSTFRCIVGQQKVIYYDNLIKGKDDGLRSPSSVACTVYVPEFNNKDMNYDRCWSIPANQVTTTIVGSHKMMLYSYDYKLKLIDKCDKTIKVIPKTGLTSNHNIVIIGDSNIDGSYILKTIYDRFVWLGGVQPTFVGSRTSTFDDVTIKHEGISGTTVYYWTTSSSPFWNSETGKLDVSNYRSKNNISGCIDVAVIALGINNCILTGAPVASSIKPLVDAFIEDNPNCKVILELPHLGANTMGGGWMAYPYSNRKILYYTNVLAQRKSYIDYYENTPEYIGKVVIGEGCYCIDRYYGFPNSTKKMSNIIDVQEFVHTNCVHPNRMGYEQEGQEYFVTILDMLQTIEAKN